MLPEPDDRASSQRRPAPGCVEQPAPAELLHELTEALTAAGNYLTAASRMLDTGADPPDMTVRQALEKSMGQFLRAVEALRRLRNSVS
jgi:hypothetical protein